MRGNAGNSMLWGPEHSIALFRFAGAAVFLGATISEELAMCWREALASC